MTIMGKYCKAYMYSQLSKFEQWSDYAMKTKQMKDVDDDVKASEESFKEDDILYLQENYLVTEGIYKDKNIVFEHVTQEWKDYCTEKLNFEIPIYETSEMP
jgi:hypothetical protein